jgi:hypothetical protein
VYWCERAGDELGKVFQDPHRPTVNRFLDSLMADDPDGHCRLEGEAGSGIVTGALIEPDGIRLLLDRPGQ